MKEYTGERLSKRSFRGFFRNNLYVILAFLIPVAIMSAVFVLRHYFPFGNRQIMVIDSWHQYYPFLAEYQEMLKEGSSLMYSWNTGGGSSFLGVIANYLASPLYLLSAFVPSGTPWLQAFLLLTVVLRIGCAGMFFAIFLRKVFGRNDLSIVTFSLMYAFCAFVLGYYWNMMWLDTFALMPLVIAGVVGVLRDKKFSLYIISLALSLIFSFYIGYMVCLFVLIVSICYTLVSFVSMKESLKNAGKMVLYTVIALMLTAFITVPAYLALNSSDSAGSTGGFPTEFTINYGYGYESNSFLHVLYALARTATNMLAYTHPIKVDAGLPNIACGVLALVLLFFYFTTKKIKLKEKIVSISLCVFFLLSFVVNQLNYIWHGMSTPAMVYYRWSFIFSFAVIVLAYRAFILLDSFGKKTFIAATGLLALYLAAAFFLQKKLSVAITLAGAVVIILGFILYRKGKLKYRVLSLLLCLFVICEMSLSAYMGVSTVGYSENDNYPENYQEVTQLVEIAGADSGEEICRTEFVSPYTLNDGALYSLYGISTFNSMVDSSYAEVLKDMGLAASMVNNRYVYWEGSPVANLFLNIKYLITRDGEALYDEGHTELIATTDECAIYENTSYVPMGFMADPALLGYEIDQDGWVFPAEVQNDLFSLSTGIDENVFVEVEPVSDINCEYADKISPSETIPYYYKLDLTEVEPEATQDEAESDEEGALMWMEYEIEEDGSYYGLFRSTSDDVVDIIVNGNYEDVREINQEYACFVAMGEYKKGDTVRVETTAEYGKNTTVALRLVRTDEEVLNNGVDKLRQNTMELTSWDDRGLSGTIQVDEEGLFYTSVLYTDGWKAYVDGEEVEITPLFDTFIAFELSEGEHEIELVFTTKGLYAGIVISCLGIAAFVLLCVLSSRCKKKKAFAGLTAVSEENTTPEQTETPRTEDGQAENCTDINE